MDNKDKVEEIKNRRAIVDSVDSPELKEKRERFLNLIQTGSYLNPINTLELYKLEDGEVIKGIKSQFQLFNKYHNTRTQSYSETRLEIDKLPYKEAIAVMCETMLSLIRKSYHFAVFYAEGGRSPHIIIYDFDELEELDTYQRFKAQAFFWRQIMPFGLFQYADKSIWDKDHYVPLEFSIHWKHKTPFNLLFEYLPRKPDFSYNSEPSDKYPGYCASREIINLTYEKIGGVAKCNT